MSGIIEAEAAGVAPEPPFAPAEAAAPTVDDVPAEEGAGEGSMALLALPPSWLSGCRARWLFTEAPELWRDRWKTKNQACSSQNCLECAVCCSLVNAD